MTHNEDLLKYSIGLSPADTVSKMSENIRVLEERARLDLRRRRPNLINDARQLAAGVTPKYYYRKAPEHSINLYVVDKVTGIVNEIGGTWECMNPYEYVYEYCLLRTTFPLAFPLTSVSRQHSNYWKSISLHRA